MEKCRRPAASGFSNLSSAFLLLLFGIKFKQKEQRPNDLLTIVDFGIDGHAKKTHTSKTSTAVQADR